MRFDRSVQPRDIPPPPSIDEVAARFGAPLYTLAPQPSVEEVSASTVGHGRDGGPIVLESVALSYTLWRNPGDHSDPANLAELSDELRASLEAPPIAPLPQWMIETRERMRYPWLWDAVRTTRRTRSTPEKVLIAHVRYILMNCFREERMRPSLDGTPPGILEGAPTERAIERGVEVIVDAEPVPGLRLDTDPHVLALAVPLGEDVLTAVLPRDDLPLLDLAFATRTPPAASRAG